MKPEARGHFGKRPRYVRDLKDLAHQNVMYEMGVAAFHARLKRLAKIKATKESSKALARELISVQLKNEGIGPRQ